MSLTHFDSLPENLRNQLRGSIPELLHAIIEGLRADPLWEVDVVTPEGVELDRDLVCLVMHLRHLNCMPELNAKMLELCPRIFPVVKANPRVLMSAFASHALAVLRHGPEAAGMPTDWAACTYHLWLIARGG
jgi:hypothetical protein